VHRRRRVAGFSRRRIDAGARYRYLGKQCGIRGSRRRPCSWCPAEIFRASRSAQARCCGLSGIRSAGDRGEKVAGTGSRPRF